MARNSHDEDQLAPLREPPPVACTSIYSKTDGVVAWQCSLNPDTDLSENLGVKASHIGLGVNPLAIYALSDRLAQPDFRGGSWKKFAAPAALRWLYQ